jgi:hypothetical protein
VSDSHVNGIACARPFVGEESASASPANMLNTCQAGL